MLLLPSFLLGGERSERSKHRATAMPMRLYFIIILATTLFISCSAARPAAPLQINGPIKLLQFPEPWLKRKGDAEVGVNDSIQYVVRKSKTSNLLFAVKQGFDGSLFGKEVSDFPVKYPNYDYYSDNRFAVNPDGPLQIKLVTDEEWYSSEKLLQSYYFINEWDPQATTTEGVRYNERVYRKSGETWGNEVALVSPRKTRIAVFSYTSREKVSKSFIPGLQNTEPGSGEVFLDIYDISSGEKVAAVRSPYGRKPNGFAPSMIFGASIWIEDRYIVMPLDPDLERALLGVFPDK